MDYNYDRIIITIAIICFALGAGAYYLYENNFNLISKIEKCADQRIPGASEKSKFLALDKKKKLSYDWQYQRCLAVLRKTSKRISYLF
jgi:hypothetical protein